MSPTPTKAESGRGWFRRMTFLRNTWTKTSPLLPSNPASRAARVSQRPLTIRAYPSQYKTCYLTSERIQNSTRTRWARDANPSGPCRVFGLTCAFVVDIHDPALAATDEAQSVLCVGHPSRFSIIVPLEPKPRPACHIRSDS